MRTELGTSTGTGCFVNPLRTELGTGTGTGCFVNKLRTEWGTRLGTGTGTDFLVNQLGTELGTTNRNGLFREPMIQNSIGNKIGGGPVDWNKIGERHKAGMLETVASPPPLTSPPRQSGIKEGIKVGVI